MAGNKKHPDFFLLGTIIAIVVFGLAILASVSAPYSYNLKGDSYHFFRHQVIFGLLPGLVLAFFFYKISLSWLKKYITWAFLGNLVLMVMVFLPVIGTELEGARRWIGFGSLTLQPSEFLKLSFILYLALWLEKRTAEKEKGKTELRQNFGAFAIALVVVAGLLILQPDISTLGVVSVTAVVMYFLSGTVIWHSVALILTGLAGLLILIKIAPYRMNRILVFLNPELDPMGIGYQVKHAIISIGSGGLIGLGLGLGTQKFGFLPQSISDAVFAIFSEETGFAGALFLIFLFLLFLWRGFKVIKASPDKFSKLAASGIVCWICLQSFVNIGSMTGVLPLMGIPLPFVSYGGTALAIELAAMGILLNISKQRA